MAIGWRRRGHLFHMLLCLTPPPLAKKKKKSRLVFTRHQTMAGYWQLNSIFQGIRGTGLMALLLDDSIPE